ncbi:MAG: cytochrome c oxidase assembly factor Coa1 family protein, partial [Pseudomonadota bacterium]
MARNWKWFVPVGCLGTIVLAAAAVVGFIFLIMGGIQSTDVFQNALAKARANAQLIVAIGEPMDPSFITTGTISTSGSSGEANLEA